MLNRDDLKEEVIAGYRVTSARKKLWVCELDMLGLLENTCKKNDIEYYLLFGTALGAIRHKGFIPWDDDIDLGMRREDFEKFLACDKSDWPEYIDIQFGLSERGVDCLLRIRDGRTTGITWNEVDKPGNKGAFIEIYVFDYVQDNYLRKIQLKLSEMLIGCMSTYYTNKEKLTFKNQIKKKLAKMVKIQRLWSIYQYVCQYQNKKKDECEYVDTITLPFYAKTGENMFKASDLRESICAEFEYTSVRIPVGYDGCLKKLYGNYMSLPPVEERGAHHNNQVFYDSSLPYTVYENSEVVKRFFQGEIDLDCLEKEVN